MHFVLFRPEFRRLIRQKNLESLVTEIHQFPEGLPLLKLPMPYFETEHLKSPIISSIMLPK